MSNSTNHKDISIDMKCLERGLNKFHCLNMARLVSMHQILHNVVQHILHSIRTHTLPL